MKREQAVARSCVDKLVKEFLQYPFLYRTQHDMHCFLWSNLENGPLGKKKIRTRKLGFWVRPFYHEYPTREGAGKKFDLAILRRETSLEIREYDHKINQQQGWPGPEVAIEVERNNYYRNTLESNLHKLTRRGNEVQLGILLNFFIDKRVPRPYPGSRKKWIEILRKRSRNLPSLEIRDVEVLTKQFAGKTNGARDPFEVDSSEDFTIKHDEVISNNHSLKD